MNESKEAGPASKTADVQEHVDAEWGFSSRKSGMAMQTKIGLLLCLLLVCAFGFVVYSRTGGRNGNDDGGPPEITATPPSQNDGRHEESQTPDDPFAETPQDGHGNAYTDEQTQLPREQVGVSRHEQQLQQVSAGQSEPAPTGQSGDFSTVSENQHWQDSSAELPRSQNAGGGRFQSSAESGFGGGQYAQSGLSEAESGFSERQQSSQHEPSSRQFDNSSKAFQQTAERQGNHSPDDAGQPSGEFSPFDSPRTTGAGVEQRPEATDPYDSPHEAGADPLQDSGFVQRSPGDHQQAQQETENRNVSRRAPTGDQPEWDQPNEQTARESESGYSGADVPTEDWGDPDAKAGSDAFAQRTGDGDRDRQQSQQPWSQSLPADSDDRFEPAASQSRQVEPDRTFAGEEAASQEDPFGEPGSGAAEQSYPIGATPSYDFNDNPDVHVVKKGDSFWSISKARYGAGRYYKALARYNRARIPDPQKMRPGMKVLVPDRAVLEARFRDLFPDPPSAGQAGRDSDAAPGFFVTADGQPRYRVGRHDTLTAIAQKHLGRSSRWVQILAINRDQIQNARQLKVGTVLRLPADASALGMAPRDREVR